MQREKEVRYDNDQRLEGCPDESVIMDSITSSSGIHRIGSSCSQPKSASFIGQSDRFVAKSQWRESRRKKQLVSCSIAAILGKLLFIDECVNCQKGISDRKRLNSYGQAAKRNEPPLEH